VAIEIEELRGEKALTEFVEFYDRVYEPRPVRWGAMAALELPMLLGTSPFAEDRTLRPLVAREGGEIVARCVAAVDQRYLDHWRDDVGHVALFEALPGARQATRQLMDEACGWLASQGMQAARCGFGLGEFPFAIDSYDDLPPNLVRQNPPYYHALLKDAGYESEQGWVDYKIVVTPDLVERWERALEGARAQGYEIVPLRDVPEDKLVDQFVATWNTAFDKHWGAAPFSEAEFALLVEVLGPMGMLDLSVLAYEDGEPVGVLWVNPEMTAMALTSGDREVRDDERLNTLGIGVLPQARGRGVNLAMASYAYLQLVEQGYSHLSYTLVLDDNWPSRRTGERLGGYVCANYMVYRRNLGRRTP
jgi:GNAT superfamily N-acetyltransferase